MIMLHPFCQGLMSVFLEMFYQFCVAVALRQHQSLMAVEFNFRWLMVFTIITNTFIFRSRLPANNELVKISRL